MGLPRHAGLAALAVVLGLGAAPASQACYSAPAQQTVLPGELLAGARDVSLARVVHVADLGGHLVRYDFVVERRLLGPGRAAFSVSGRAVGNYTEREASPDHGDAAFWQSGGGRLMNEGDCVIRPAFRLGQRYLMFMDQPATWRSFERIAGDDDKWLAFVGDKLRAKEQP